MNSLHLLLARGARLVPSTFIGAAFVGAASVGMLTISSCAVRPDHEHPNQLTTTMRILAIGSTPAEIPLGESAEVSALVFAPDSTLCGDPADISYKWSWCPVRGGEDEGFECAISAEEAQALWQQFGGEGEFPTYDLGEGATAELTNVVGNIAEAICAENVAEGGESSDFAFQACLESLQASVRLETRYCGQEAVAIKSLSLLGEDKSSDPEFVPNENPTFTGSLLFRSVSSGDELPEGAPLKSGDTYWMNLEIEETECESDEPGANCLAEWFIPESTLGLAEEARRETLVMSWYMTKGHTFPETLNGEDYVPDTGSNLGQQTFYVHGVEAIEGMLTNLLDLSKERPGDAEVLVVLRDERGGVAWRRFPFTVEAD